MFCGLHSPSAYCDVYTAPFKWQGHACRRCSQLGHVEPHRMCRLSNALVLLSINYSCEVCFDCHAASSMDTQVLDSFHCQLLRSLLDEKVPQTNASPGCLWQAPTCCALAEQVDKFKAAHLCSYQHCNWNPTSRPYSCWQIQHASVLSCRPAPA